MIWQMVGLSREIVDRMPADRSTFFAVAVLWRVIYAFLGALAVVVFIAGTKGALATGVALSFIFLLVFLLIFFLRTWFLNQFLTELSYRAYSIRESLVVKLELVLTLILSVFFSSSLAVFLLTDPKVLADLSERERTLSIASYKGFDVDLRDSVFKDRERLGLVNDFAARRRIGFTDSEANFFSIQRRALIVANSGYTRPHSALPGVEADLVKVREVFVNAGYEVSVIENKSFLDTERLLLEFVARVTSNDLIVLYVAGHGFQADGSNFLLSVDRVSLSDEFKFRHNLHQWYSRILEKNPYFAFFVLDACRELIDTRAGLRSLSAFRPPDASNFIGLSSVSAGQLANDSAGGDCLGPLDNQGNCSRRMSPFASEFVLRFAEDGLLTDLPQRISNGVVARVSQAIREYPKLARDFKGPEEDKPPVPVPQSPEVTIVRQALPIRHLDPASPLLTYAAKIDESPFFRSVQDECPPDSENFISCLDDLRRDASYRIDAVERGREEILGLRQGVYNFLITNSGKVSDIWRHVTEYKMLSWFFLTFLILTLLLIDFLLIYIGDGKRPFTANSISLKLNRRISIRRISRLYQLGIMSYKASLRRTMLGYF